MGFFTASRDRIVENMAVAYLNRSVLPAYGRLIELKLNSEQKSIDVTLELNGEASPVRLVLHDYSLTKENGRLFLTVRRFTTSREWLTTLANDLAAGKKIPLPEQAGTLVAQIL